MLTAKSLAAATLAFSLLPAATLAFGQSAVPAITGSAISQSDAQQVLDFHNARRTDVHVPPLEWSQSLAAAAQNWANQLARNGCNLEHKPSNQFGENLFSGSGVPYTALSAAQDWYSEIHQYRYGVLTEQNFGPTGHYTQMVWRGTTQVGMGQAFCRGGTVIVAEYAPAGNYIGQRPY